MKEEFAKPRFQKLHLQEPGFAQTGCPKSPASIFWVAQKPGFRIFQDFIAKARFHVCLRNPGFTSFLQKPDSGFQKPSFRSCGFQKPGFRSLLQKPGFRSWSQKPGFRSLLQKPGFRRWFMLDAVRAGLPAVPSVASSLGMRQAAPQVAFLTFGRGKPPASPAHFSTHRTSCHAFSSCAAALLGSLIHRALPFLAFSNA